MEDVDPVDGERLARLRAHAPVGIGVQGDAIGVGGSGEQKGEQHQ